MADGDFILSEEDRAKLRERMGQVEDTRRDLTDQRNAIVETDSPDDAAYDLKRSKELGIPRAAVGGDRDGHKAQQKFEELNRLAEEAPKSRRWLAEPDNYAIARDEVKDISLMEKLMAAGSSVMYWGASDFGEALPDVAKASPAKFKQQYYGTLQQQQEMAGAYQRELDAWKARRKPIFSDGQVDIGAFNARLFGQQKKPEAPLALKMVGLGADDSYSELGRKAAMGLLDKDAQQSAYQARKALEEFQAKMPQTGDFVTDSALSGVSSLINMLPMIGMAIATKSPNAPSVLMGGQVQGESYARAREEGLSPLEADQYAGSQAAIDLADHLAKGETDKAEVIKTFYDEYFAVMDLPAEFYIETVRDVFQEHLLPQGMLMHRGRAVNPAAIRRMGLMTVEGEKDDICSIGQTLAAQDLCTGVRTYRKVHHMQAGVGHYGVFNGRKWRENIAPTVKDFMRTHAKPAAKA